MPLDPGLRGRTYPPTEPYEVGREKIREFAEALGVTDFEVAPPTFAAVLSLPAGARVLRDLGLGESAVLHREQSFTHHRPIRAGDVLTVRVTVVDAKTVAGSEVLVTRDEITTVGGEPVCTATTTLAVPGERRPR